MPITEVRPPRGYNCHLWSSCESRSVKPNLKKYDNDRPIIAISADMVLKENGEVLTHDDFRDRLPQEPRSIIVTYGAEKLLLKLHERYSEDTRWQWKVSVSEDSYIHKKVVYFGFKRANGHGGKHNYHIVVDINSFYRIHEWSEHGDIKQLLSLGKEVRQFCKEFNLDIRPTAAGLANQLLKHPLFYPAARRQVPTFINEEARKHLPGNHYSLYGGIGQKYAAVTYIDQQAAHHHAAINTPLPNSNSISVQGHYSSSEEKQGTTYARRRADSDSLYQRLRRYHGLLQVWAYVPHIHPKSRKFAPKCITQRAGLQQLWLWSNEIDYVESFGVELRYIISVWGSEEIDRRVPVYARWAQDVQGRYPWLKTVTLMVYGLLAKRPQEFTVYFNQGSAKKEPFILANQMVEGHESRYGVVPATANVLQRGLIEAYVRTLSLDMARQCTERNHEVISIYADGIFLRTCESGQLPLVLPWREKEHVTDLEFECATRFRSNELTRFPGTLRFRKDYAVTT